LDKLLFMSSKLIRRENGILRIHEGKGAPKKVKGMRIDESNHTLSYLCGAIALFRSLAADQGWSEQEVEKAIADASKDPSRPKVLAELAKLLDITNEYPAVPYPADISEE